MDTKLVAITFKHGIVFVDGQPVWAEPEQTGVDPETFVDIANLNERILEALHGGATVEFGENGIPPLSKAPAHKIAILLDTLDDDTYIVIGGAHRGMSLGALKQMLDAAQRQRASTD